MNPDAGSPAQPARTAAPARLARVRQANLAALVLLVAEYVIGMYVNLYVTIPGPATATAWAARSPTARRCSAFTP